MPGQVLFKLAEDLVTCFVRQAVDFEETGLVIDSSLIQFKKVAGDF